MPRQYGNFDLSLYACERAGAGGDRYKVRVAFSSVAEQSDDEADIVEVPEGLAKYVSAFHGRGKANTADFQEWCRRLGELLLPPNARALLVRNLDDVRLNPERALRFRIRCEADELAQVPWEFAYVPLTQAEKAGFSKTGFLVANAKVCVVRYETLNRQVNSPSRSGEPLTVLFASAQPKGLAELQLARERKLVRQSLKQIEPNGFHPVAHASKEKIQKLLLDRSFDVFHFSGHARLLDGKGVLAFEDAQRGIEHCSGDELGVLLAEKGVRLAGLFACDTAAIEGLSPWGGIARSLVSVGIPAVLGMQYRILDESTVSFVQTLYNAMAKELALEDAITEARRTLLLRDALLTDLGVPVLYLRSSEQQDAAGAGATHAAPGIRTALAAGLAVAKDYKDIHDELHRAQGAPYKELLRTVGKPQPPQDEEMLGLLGQANELIGLKGRIVEVGGRGNCDREHIEQLSRDLDKATPDLEQWTQEPAQTKLLANAVVRFGHIFSVHLGRFDVILQEWIQKLPRQEVVSADTTIDAAEKLELTAILKDLNTWAMRQKACRELEVLLRELQSTSPLNLLALRVRWELISEMLDQIVDGWDSQIAVKLRDASLSLFRIIDSSAEAADAAGALPAWAKFSSAFGLGYFDVDTNLKGACSKHLPRLLRSTTVH
jgi:hypothetical protein